MAEAFEDAARQYEAKREPLPVDPWEFATRCALTFDENANQRGLESTRPFPSYDYLRDILAAVDRDPFCWIVKSGQLTVSWALQVYFLHQVLTKRAYRLAYYCLTQMKAEGHIESRFWRLYQNIPAHFNKPHAEFKNGRLTVYHDGPGTLPTSFIIPQAAEQGKAEDAAAKMRSETWTAALLDESAFYPNLGELHNSLVPRAARMVHVSTPNGHNFFETIGLGSVQFPEKQAVSLPAAGAQEVRNGVLRWVRNGFSCLRVHYSAHPDRNPATERGANWRTSGQAKTTARLWDREQECSFEVAAGWPVYDTEPRIDEQGKPSGGLIVKAQTYTPGLRVFRGWDFGYLWPFCVFSQLKPALDATGRQIGDRLCVIHEETLQNSSTDQFGEHVNKLSATRFPFAEYVDYCDFYGGNQRTSRNPKTDVEILNSVGIYPTSTAMQVKFGVELGQKLMLDGRLEVDPSCTFLLTALKSGYHRDDKGEIPDGAKKPHPHGDVADAFRYIVAHLFGFQNEKRGQTSHRPIPATAIHDRGAGHGHYKPAPGTVKPANTSEGMQTQTCFRPRLGFTRK